MSKFENVLPTENLVIEYCENGDYDALKLVDFSIFPWEIIRRMYTNVNQYINHGIIKQHTYKRFERMCACLEYLKTMLDAEFKWETDELLIHKSCYCVNSNCTNINTTNVDTTNVDTTNVDTTKVDTTNTETTNSETNCTPRHVHKVFIKSTQKYMMVYHDELQKFVAKKKLNIPHFA